MSPFPAVVLISGSGSQDRDESLSGHRPFLVLADINLAAIESALRKVGNKDYEVRKLAGLNHLFQTAQTCHPREYGEIEETIAPSVLQIIGDWILRKTRK